MWTTARAMLQTTIGAALVIALGAGANAQDWPARPVTLVVPYAAGGPVDTIAFSSKARYGSIEDW